MSDLENIDATGRQRTWLSSSRVLSWAQDYHATLTTLVKIDLSRIALVNFGNEGNNADRTSSSEALRNCLLT
ncbi:hypothetical protein PSPO01_10173 [Paraphaeosphaeria sporulosa]